MNSKRYTMPTLILWIQKFFTHISFRDFSIFRFLIWCSEHIKRSVCLEDGVNSKLTLVIPRNYYIPYICEQSTIKYGQVPINVLLLTIISSFDGLLESSVYTYALDVHIIEYSFWRDEENYYKRIRRTIHTPFIQTC